MGRKGKWFGAVKRVFSPESKEKKSHKSKHSSNPYSNPPPPENRNASPVASPPPIPSQEIKPSETEHEQNDHAYSMALATAAAAEAAVAAAQAAAEVVRLTTIRFAGKSREEIAAIKIQTAFRGHLARRALRALKGLVRLKSLVDGNSVRRQSTTTLRCMQTLSRVQSQIRTRRIRMTEENQDLQRQLQLKREQELEALKASMGDEWDDSLQSKEQIEASLVSKHEAAIKRERALAYAYSHQWKSSLRSVNPMFTDMNNPNWGWSWLERWMASRPWDSRSLYDKDLSSDHASVKSVSQSVAGESAKAHHPRDSNTERPSPGDQKPNQPMSRQSPATQTSKGLSVAGKIKLASPGPAWCPADDDTRSTFSMQSERNRRHSIAGSSLRDDESLASSPAIPSYMTPTESARAKSRFHSLASDNVNSPSKGSTGSVKKRLSFPASPNGVRRHSGPPKLGASPIPASNGGRR